MSTEQRDSARGGWIAVVLVAAGVLTGGCGITQASTDSAHLEEPATVEPVAGTDAKQVTLTELATKRVGVETVAIAAAPNGGTTVPYAAVVYTPDGGTWVFVETSPRSYLRERVVVANVAGAGGTEAFLSQSPPVGTLVVKTGVMELYGAELEVGK